MCREREGKNLSKIIKSRWLKYFHYMQRELGSKGSAELKVLRILRLKKLQCEEIIAKIDCYEDVFLLCYADHYIVKH